MGASNIKYEVVLRTIAASNYSVENNLVLSYVMGFRVHTLHNISHKSTLQSWMLSIFVL